MRFGFFVTDLKFGTLDEFMGRNLLASEKIDIILSLSTDNN